EAELTIRCASWDLGECFKLFNSQIALANLRTDRSIKVTDVSAVYCVFCYRRKFHCAPTFAEGFLLSPKCSIDQAQQAKSRALRPFIGLCADNSLLFRARSVEGGACTVLVPFHPSDQTFRVSASKLNRTNSCVKTIVGNRCQCAISCCGVAAP